MTTPASRNIDGPDGNTIHLLEWSRGGVPLLLVHGYGNEAHIWDDFAPRIAPHYRTLAVDLRGHGDSSHDAKGRYLWEDHARDLTAVCDALALERLVLVGHSLGGRIALTFAGTHPQRMAGLVVVDAGPEHDPRGSTRIRAEVTSRTQGGGDGSFAEVREYEHLLARHYPAAAAGSLARMARSELRRREDGRYVRKVDPLFMAGAEAATPEAEQALREETARKLWATCRRVPCPALVVRGAASDILSPDVAEKMAEQGFPQGRLAVVPKAAHSVMVDNPQGFAEAVLDFALG